MPSKSKVQLKDIGLDIGLAFAKHVYKTDYLHYGIWPEGLKVEPSNVDEELVKSGLLKSQANLIYKSYMHNKNNKLPYVTGKLAISKDNFIYSKNKKKITNNYSDNITQLLRYKNDSILISSRTLNTDNPKLSCRIEGLSYY